MDRESFTPISATFVGATMVLTDLRGDRLPINMPSPGDAQFSASGMDVCLRRARRAGE